MHKAAQVTIVIRPKNKMEVVGHDAPPDQPHRDPILGAHKLIKKAVGVKAE